MPNSTPNSNHFHPARAGEQTPSVTPASVPPIFQTTAFDIADLEQLRQVYDGEVAGHIYSRDGNPNHSQFENAVAQMEHAEAAIAAASGMGSLAAVFLSHLKTGDHVIAARVLYGKTLQLLNELQTRFGIDVTFVDATNPHNFAEAVRKNTQLAVVESLSNPLLEIADIPTIAAALSNVPLLVDSTFTTPELIQPLSLGAAMVFHSVSKYLNGHGDVTLGVIAGSTHHIQRIAAHTSLFGMNANPFDCWLALRGLKTLPLRMARVSDTAQQIATFLESHPRVARVFYPGLQSHSQYSLGRHLLPNGCSGMLSFEIRAATQETISQFMRALDAIPFSPTLADARTTISYPAGTSHRPLTPEERDALGVRDSLVRVSIGLEQPAMLIAEFESALGQL